MLPPTLSCDVRCSSTPRSPNRRASERWTIVAPTWDLMSSPTIGRPAFLKRLFQYCSRAMKTGMQLTIAQPASRICSTYHFVACSEPTGQVGDDDVGAGLLEDLDDVDGRARRLGDLLGEVLAEAVVGHAALDGDAQVRDVFLDELDRVVLAGPDRLGEVLADLVRVDVERGRELDVADVVAAEVDVHEARDALGRDRRPCSSGRPARRRSRSCRRR